MANTINIVGVCGSGKSTLAKGLQALGYDARQVSQEHSGVPDLWRRRHPAAALVYLDASGPVLRQRYPDLDLHDAYLAVERQRLDHARQHADCYLFTDDLTPAQVIGAVCECLVRLGLPPPKRAPI
jgi:hypothetical protein